MKESNNDDVTLQKLLTTKIKERGLSRSELVRLLGYTNVSKGLRRLDGYLTALHAPSDEFVVRLLSTLEINGLEFHKALTSSINKINFDADRRAREHFRPHIKLSVKMDISPLFVRQILYNKYCVKPIPNGIKKLSFNEEIDFLFSVYRELFCNVLTNMPEHIAKKIKDTGFRYYRHYDSYLEFNADGMLEKIVSSPPLPEVKEPLGNRIVDMLSRGMA